MAFHSLRDMGSQASGAVPELRRLLVESPDARVREYAGYLVVRLAGKHQQPVIQLAKDLSSPADLLTLQNWAAGLLNATAGAKGELHVSPGDLPACLVLHEYPPEVVVTPARSDSPRRITVTWDIAGQRWGLCLANSGTVLADPARDLLRLADGAWAFTENP
jgi:hypothetical protein